MTKHRAMTGHGRLDRRPITFALGLGFRVQKVGGHRRRGADTAEDGRWQCGSVAVAGTVLGTVHHRF